MSIVRGVALITGSAQGLGRSIALRLARDGFDIALNDIASKRDELRSVADDIGKIGQRTHLVPVDVTVEEEVKGMVEDAVKELDGSERRGRFLRLGLTQPYSAAESNDWERVMAVNARGAFLCYKYAAQQMIKQGRGGRIIGASSAIGKMGMHWASAYSASKFAVRGLTQTAGKGFVPALENFLTKSALELGGHNITVNSYAPGLIKTPMTAGIFDAEGGSVITDSEALDSWKSLITKKPIKCDGQPEDIASIVSYLASKEAHFITGKS
ncbi:hypothetical protein J3R82DRAFT_1689 [Butyriboletus roseoflavus]|nr:hypothetical protein J3R82DRAFT_1689 [Butyriboletus roseoflavus]